jgi:DNA ligase-1
MLSKVFTQLESTNSVKDKEKILFKNKDNPYLPELLEANLNPYRLFQFNKFPVEYPELSSYDKFTSDTNYKMFTRLLGELQTRKVTGNAAKQELIDTFKRFDASEFELYKKILLKSPIGVGASTVNKVWPDLIPEFKVMLAPNKIPQLTQVNYPVIVQPKLDGYRCIYRDGQLFSRSGLIFPNINLMTYFAALENVGNYVLDGELYIHGIAFQNITKTLNADRAPIPIGLKYVIYDCMSEKEWESQKCKTSYQDRLSKLRELLNDRVADYKKIIDIKSDKCKSAAEVMPLYKQYLKDGYEGVMLKDVSGLYRWKRTSLRSGEMLKLKPFKTVDLKIKEIYDGEGDFSGMAGGVVVDYNGVSVRVGSGYTVVMRQEMAKQPSDFIGKTIEIQYFEETEDKSLRFPTFKRFREDKD